MSGKFTWTDYPWPAEVSVYADRLTLKRLEHKLSSCRGRRRRHQARRKTLLRQIRNLRAEMLARALARRP